MGLEKSGGGDGVEEVEPVLTSAAEPTVELMETKNTQLEGVDQPGFRFWRYRVFLGLYLSYVPQKIPTVLSICLLTVHPTHINNCFYPRYVVYALTRSTFTFISPSLQRNGMLTLSQIGAVASTFPVAYGISKLVTGFIADNASPRIVRQFSPRRMK